MSTKRSRAITIAAAGTLTLATAISAAAATLPASSSPASASADAYTSTISRQADVVSFAFAGKEISGSELPLDFPDYRPWAVAAEAERVPIDVPELRAALAAAPGITKVRDSDGASYQLTVLAISPDGVRVADDGSVGVNKEFLLQALEAGRGEQLTMELDGPIGPLTIRNPDRAEHLSVLMPVRLD